jgi:Flp pilus assembly protein TadG
MAVAKRGAADAIVAVCAPLFALAGGLGIEAIGRHRRAVAAVEFALIAPMLAIVLIGSADYGIAQWTRSCLANAVAQGAYYAFLTGPGVSVATVEHIVENASSLSSAQFRITAPFPLACYCPTGSPATLGTAVSPTVPCTATCSDGSKAGAYLTITAPYQLPFWISIPFAGAVNLSTITEVATVRLQ